MRSKLGEVILFSFSFCCFFQSFYKTKNYSHLNHTHLRKLGSVSVPTKEKKLTCNTHNKVDHNRGWNDVGKETDESAGHAGWGLVVLFSYFVWGVFNSNVYTPRHHCSRVFNANITISISLRLWQRLNLTVFTLWMMFACNKQRWTHDVWRSKLYQKIISCVF